MLKVQRTKWFATLLVGVGCNAVFGIERGLPLDDESAGTSGSGGSTSGGGGKGGKGGSMMTGGLGGEGGEADSGSGGSAGSSVGGTAGKGTGGAGGAAGKGGGGGKGGSAGTDASGGNAGDGAGGSAGTTGGSAGAGGNAGTTGGGMGGASGGGAGGTSAGTAGSAGSGGQGGMSGSGGGGAFTLTINGFSPMAGCAGNMASSCADLPRNLQSYMGGPNLSPAMSWSNAPVGTMSFAVVLSDLSNGLNHWVHWNLPGGSAMLVEDIDALEPNQASIGSGNGYLGPGAACNVYEFRLYALSDATFTPTGDATNPMNVITQLNTLPGLLGTAVVRGRTNYNGACP